MSDVENDRIAAEDLAVEMAAIQPRLYGFILKRLADREQTLEVLQQTNLVLCRKAGEFRRGSSFTAWAFTIAKFQIMAWRKSEGSGRLIFTDQVCELLDRSATDEACAVDERIPILRGCLGKLAERERSLIQRRYRDGEPIALIADSLTKSIEAIGMQLTRIRRQLADCVGRGLSQENQYEI